MPVMRAKMKIASVEKFESCERISFSAVGKSTSYPSDGTDEDNTFARWTPSADLNMLINNPSLLNIFEPGQVFYVDFTEANPLKVIHE
jgi:hypothetical protein